MRVGYVTGTMDFRIKRVKAIRRFTVRPVLPESLAPLDRLANNFRWSWNLPTRRLFQSIDPALWANVSSPLEFLGALDQSTLTALADDNSFIDRLNTVAADLDEYLTEPRWYQGLGESAPQGIAYFSPEFGVDGSLPQYSGGLGILAGDHLKAASDLGVPVTAVGLFYRFGYFHQSMTREGWQTESYPLLDPTGLGLSLVRHADRSPVEIALAMPDGPALFARIWRARIGRVTLLLLDTDTPTNSAKLRGITDRLYGGGGEHRLRQELLLGIGGLRAVRVWSELRGLPQPTVYHTNEGHAGFQGLERIHEFIAQGLDFDTALQQVRASTVFTTHTPVPAGIDRFERPLVERYVTETLLPGVEPEKALALGCESYAGGDPNTFNMAVLGLRLAKSANGVSKLHGVVSRTMFGPLWPGFDPNDVPITSITNGVHAATWIADELTDLSVRGFGNPRASTNEWTDKARVSDDELWGVRTQLKENLVADARRRAIAAYTSESPTAVAPVWLETVLDPTVLTIGFARRVPTYKRLTLMLRDPERLRKLLTDPERPIQIVIAGKSHPADDDGKQLIQQLIQFSQGEDVRSHMLFLPDYDMTMAKTLYPGCDVWLNNPLRPLEACGTSGMKAAMNGVLNLSVLDGWWDECYDGTNGWAIPTADGSASEDERDDVEAAALYDLIEYQLVPTYYDRTDGIPVAWLDRVRHTMASLGPVLSANRMVQDYVTRLYVPAHEAQAKLADNAHAGARDLASYLARVEEAWPRVAVRHVESGGVGMQPHVGDELRVRALIDLDVLAVDDVVVHVVYGRTDSNDVIVAELSHSQELIPDAALSDGVSQFSGVVTLDVGGSFGYNVRVLPNHPLLVSQAEPGLIAQAS